MKASPLAASRTALVALAKTAKMGNPMNADTDYNGTWDGDEDWDGDGFSNLCEVRQGYLDHDNAYWNNIYNSGSKPAACTGSAINPIANTASNNNGSTGVRTASQTPGAPPEASQMLLAQEALPVAPEALALQATPFSILQAALQPSPFAD